MLEWLNHWDLKNPHTAWIARHASRSLIKAGHPRSFRLFGFTAKPGIKITNFVLIPTKIKLGETLTIAFSLHSTVPKPQKLAVDYIVHYQKKSGQLAPKVFKLRELSLAAGATSKITKQQKMTDFTTRVHHSGQHQVEVMVNGEILARKNFDLIV